MFCLDDYFKPALDLIESIINEKFQIINEYAKFNDHYRQILNEKPKILIENISEDVKVGKCEVSRYFYFF
jgi:hypothetical protein